MMGERSLLVVAILSYFPHWRGGLAMPVGGSSACSSHEADAKGQPVGPSSVQRPISAIYRKDETLGVRRYARKSRMGPAAEEWHLVPAKRLITRPPGQDAGISCASRLHQSAFVGHDYRLDPVPELELGQQVGDVRLNGSLADVELPGDLGVGKAAGHQLEDLDLPVGETPQLRRRRARHWPSGELFDEAAGDGWREEGVSGRHHPDGRCQLFGRGVLEQEAACPRPQGLVDELVGVVGGQHHDPAPPGERVCGEAPGRLEPVELGHSDVHENHVRVKLPDRRHRLQAVPRLAHNLQVGLRFDDHLEAGPDQALVVADQDRDAHGGGSSGRQAQTRNPPPGTGPTSSWPPYSATCSRIPISPCPLPLDPSRAWRAGGPWSVTWICSSRSRYRTRTSVQAGPACLSTLVRASWMIR